MYFEGYDLTQLWQIAGAIDLLNTREDIDVIITGRGGGSIEELWAFNEECVARAIYRSRIPVISAIGHETDYTIADFVSDLRAPTPSAAGELSVPDKNELSSRLNYCLDLLQSSQKYIIHNKRNCLQRDAKTIASLCPSSAVREKAQYLDSLNYKIITLMKDITWKRTGALRQHAASLENLNPLTVISRGYSVCFMQNSKSVISDIKGVEVGNNIDVMVKNGTLHCIVNGKSEEGVFLGTKGK
jgi:exodeoxyribonuclease VII large subunit